MKLNIKRLNDNALLPTYGSEYAAGLDLYACENDIVKAHTRKLIPTGLAMSWHGPHEKEYYMRIAPRSGLAVKHSIDIGAGLCDFDFTGEYKICFINNGDEDYYISKHDRIAQMVLERINRVEVVEVTHLDETVRGEGGFGSSDDKVNWCNFEYKEYESKLSYPPVNGIEK
jgi:dUTP pyrophosphatase